MNISTLKPNFLIACMVLLSLLTIGFRDAAIGTDTSGYIDMYQHLLNNDDINTFEYLFSASCRLFAFLNLSVGAFLSFISLLSFLSLIIIALVLNKQFNERQGNYRLYLLLCALLFISPFFYAAQVNVIRQGVVIFFLSAVYLLILNRAHWITWGIFSVLALGFHKTAIIFLCFIPFLLFSYEVVVNVTFVIGLSYCLNLPEKLLYKFAPEIYHSIVGYGSTSNYHAGRRVDFVLFTFLLGFLCYFLGKYFLKKNDQKPYNSLLKIYWILTLPFFLFGFGAYSDRYLLPAWIYITIPLGLFLNMQLQKFDCSIYWYYLFFIISSSYFILKVQGGIG